MLKFNLGLIVLYLTSAGEITIIPLFFKFEYLAVFPKSSSWIVFGSLEAKVFERISEGAMAKRTFLPPEKNFQWSLQEY